MTKKFTLSNNINIFYEYMPSVRSVSFGVFVKSGSCTETAEISGISHFIEHMLFKGTNTKTAGELAQSFDFIGGHFNAYTTKEFTCFYAKTLDYHLEKAVELLSDMLTNSRLEEKDIKLERSVILEEINMYEDSPEELVADRLFESVWDPNPISNNILGTKETLKGISRQHILDYMSKHYSSNSIVISVCGSFDEDGLIKMCENYFGKIKTAQSSQFTPAIYTPKISKKEKDIEQNHIIVGFESSVYGSDDAYEIAVLSNIFGGGMSSRLFQRIREELGLVYSVYTFASHHIPAGVFGIGCALSKKNEDKALVEISSEIGKLKKHGITEEELIRSKELLKSSLIMGLESTSGRMQSAGRRGLLLGTTLTPDELMQKVDNVTLDSVYNKVNSLFDYSKLSVSTVGKISDDEFYKKRLIF